MTTLSTLAAARDWLAVGPERWNGCGQWYWYGARGAPVRTKKHARATSALGALYLVSMNENPTDIRAAVSRLARAFGCSDDFVQVHDVGFPPGRAGWERVIAAFNAAIEAEKAPADA